MRRLRERAASGASAGGAASAPHKRRPRRDAAASDALAAPKESHGDAQAPAPATPDASGPNE
jgi:hypothetical protein